MPAEIDEKGFKTGDRLRLSVRAETTDKLLMLTTGGKVYTLAGDRLPGGRGQGEPVRLLVDIEEGHDIVDLFVHRPGAERLIVSTAGNGFVVEENELIAITRKGKQVLNVSGTEEARTAVPVRGDMVAAIGQNRRLVLFPVSQLPVMARGKGCQAAALQGRRHLRCKDLRQQQRPGLDRHIRPHVHKGDL